MYKVIMIVEDDKDLRENLRMVLESEGYEVREAKHGMDALNQLRKMPVNEQPFCIILDLMMPVMDGKTFLEILHREHPNDLAKIAVLVSTAAGRSGELLLDVPKPIAEIRKPINIDDLMSILAKFCNSTP